LALEDIYKKFDGLLSHMARAFFIEIITKVYLKELRQIKLAE